MPARGDGLEALVGARVRRVDMPSAELLAVTLAWRDGQSVLLLSTAPDRRAIALADERPRGDPASSFVRKLRKELVGGAVAAVHARAGGFALELGRGGVSRTLVAELDGRGNVVLLDEAQRVIVAASASTLAARGLGPRQPYASPEGATHEPPRSLADMRHAATALLADRGTENLEQQRRALDRALRQALKRLDRRAAAVEADAGRAREAPRLRADASALLAELHAVPKDALEAEVTDWSADPPTPRTLAIDPRLGPRAQAEAWFHRARRLERGAEMAAIRLGETERERAALEELRAQVAAAGDDQALGELAQRARRMGVRGATAAVNAERPRARPVPRGRRPYRRFVGHGERDILVGRGAAENDALTLRVARPRDHWLHARGRTGAHVVVPLDKGEDCPPELLVDAAHLAAHFSDARGEQVVDVIHTPRRYVRKQKGLPVGAVRVDREKVIALRIEPERLARLLAAEDR